MNISTRPDITSVTCLLARYLKNPSQGHLDSAKHVLKCLKGSPDWGIRCTEPKLGECMEGKAPTFDPRGCLKGMVAWPPKEDSIPPTEPFDRIDACTDSNWGPQGASHPKPGQCVQDEDMHSLLGNLVTHMGSPIDWKCAKEKCISPSVCESEIEAMSEGHRMVMGLRHLFDDLNASHIAEPTPFLHCDNRGLSHG